ncbi:shikimate dehydrogenase [Hyphomonas sp.]|uniref:shikimate dehydrogenase n=1 Tax=Hyphomonas sp. TaxID=87 RepID=UPI003918D2E1
MKLLLGVAGDPVTHSLSPFIHNGWLRDNRIDAVYSAFEIKAGELPEGLRTLAGQGVRGLNITLPHKIEALKLAARASEKARRIGAANLMILEEDGTWSAGNTDAPGFALTLDYGGIQVAGRSVFVLGAGGSARAVAAVLADRGARLTICNRTVDNAQALARAIAPQAEVHNLEEGLARLGNAALVVNTLSTGHSGGGFELPESGGGVFYDISYGRGAATALAEATRKGWRRLDGLGMLVAQAAISFRAWFGLMPDMAEAHARCRALVEATS